MYRTIWVATAMTSMMGAAPIAATATATATGGNEHAAAGHEKAKALGVAPARCRAARLPQVNRTLADTQALRKGQPRQPRELSRRSHLGAGYARSRRKHGCTDTCAMAVEDDGAETASVRSARPRAARFPEIDGAWTHADMFSESSP